MAQKILRIGTRDSELAIWQATLVQQLLKEAKLSSELVFIKSEGDVDTVTPLYEIGVQGIFTKSLDAALLNQRIDLAVHSMKDVPTKLAEGIAAAAVLERASFKDILVYKKEDDLQSIGFFKGKWNEENKATISGAPFIIATSSVRRMAQWLHRYPGHIIENLRGNVNTRLKKVAEHNWNGAIFAAAGLERINVRPSTSVDLDWMLPAPAQGAIMVACRSNDHFSLDNCQSFHHRDTALCTTIERNFLSALAGGCSTSISALAQIVNGEIAFQANIASVDGKELVEIRKRVAINDAEKLGIQAAKEILLKGGHAIMNKIRNKEFS